jgi:PPOX class probable F420-dependent enzyme
MSHEDFGTARLILRPAGESAGLRDSRSSKHEGALMPVPAEISGQKYISLTTFRKTGVPVRTPLWFAEAQGKLYFMTRNDFGKYKRIRNNPKVLVAPCTMRGKVTGPDFPATARILPRDQWPSAKRLLNQKYWLARLPFWSSKNEFLEIEFQG